jgi:hypothetical protein
MANALQLRRGTTTEHGSFTGLAGEITVDTTKDTLVIHDGSTAGGIPLAKESSISTDAATLGGQSLSQIQTAYEGYADTAAANVVDSAPATLDTLNELAAALGDDANFSTTVTNNIATKLPLAGGTMTGTLTAPSVTVDGTLDIEEVFEKVGTSTSTTGTITADILAQGVTYFTANQTANRTINFSNVNANLAIGQSVTGTFLLAQGSTAYYINAYQVDGSAATPKWSGGSAPTGGNANSLDVYTFTIIKTANATFTVLASQTQFS